MKTITHPYRATIFRTEHDPKISVGLQRFRKQLFIDRLGWMLREQDGREIDEFDTDAAVYCALTCDNEIVGGFRALNTLDPYLAYEIFPELASVRPYPRRADAWEISRFGVLASSDQLFRARLLYALMFRFAYARGATVLVAIADEAYERYLTRLGILTSRYGPPDQIGVNARGEPLRALAGEIPLLDQQGRGFQALLSLSRQLEVDDADLVSGSQRISA